MQAVQIPRTNSVPSFWCKICKVDCVTEFNFGAHIGGKKHKLKKQLILGNMNTGRPGTGSQFAGNTNRGPSENAVSGSRNDEPNAGGFQAQAVLKVMEAVQEFAVNIKELGCVGCPRMSTVDFDEHASLIELVHENTYWAIAQVEMAKESVSLIKTWRHLQGSARIKAS
ncbi:unnamed protein product [Triticum turgidum subsp. durum]|uniref:U1-type domain-containing protein n=1 Tax=Triticum turgidum subsp. durum TaxID=4567 RepID=A0A9R0S220_TRITD|nr:unnamed protein product [Triticum turgidum subsp. durum]